MHIRVLTFNSAHTHTYTHIMCFFAKIIVHLISTSTFYLKRGFGTCAEISFLTDHKCTNMVQMLQMAVLAKRGGSPLRFGPDMTISRPCKGMEAL